jgi:alginate O-acetyltransferase complex protein AlgI
MRNLFITFVIAGLWHGAAWHYAAFGAMWGIGLSVQHALQKRIALPSGVALSVGGWLLTMLFYLVSLAFFRCPDFDAAGVMVRAMFGQGTGAGTQSLRASLVVIAVASALLFTWTVSRARWWPALRTPTWRLRPVAFGVAASIAIVVASAAAPQGNDAFFYFQF